MPLIRKDTAAKADASVTATDAATLLTTGDSNERWSAARVLADQADGGEALAAALATEGDARVREAILTGLLRHPGEASVAAILPLVRSDEAGVRTGALDALRAMPTALAARLGDVLADPDVDVRILACDLARALPAAEATRMLCALLDRETEANVCTAAIDALTEVGGPEARTSLERCAARFAAEPFLTFAVKAALDRIGAASTDPRG
jgi:hypothetical protein